MLKYVVFSSTTFASKKTGLPFTTKHYFQHWIFGEGIGASFGPIENAKKMNFAQARRVARYSPSYAIEVA